MYNNNKKVKGLTFIEILIAVAILGLITILLVNILPLVFDIYSNKIEESEKLSNIQTILDRLTREIRQSIEVTDIGNYLIGTQNLGYLTINLSSEESRTYSFTLYKNKYYFTVDGEILAGPIKEIKYEGYTSDGTYTDTPEHIRAISILLVTEDDKKYTSYVVLRSEKAPEAKGIFITEIMYYPSRYDKNSGDHGTEQRDMEFIVIYNGATYTVNIERWQINGTTRIVESVIPGNNDFNLPPGRYAIIGGKYSQLNNWYYLPSNYYYFRTDQRGLYSSINSSNVELPNNNGQIILEDSKNNILDTVNYSYTWGGYPSGTSNFSLIRKSINISSNDPNNWTSNKNLNYSVIVGNITYYSYCLVPRVVISEIMYYPSPRDRNGGNRGERNMEFVEILNISNQNINIQGWSINNNRFNTLVTGSWILPPGGYAVIGGSNSTINTSYNIPLNFTYIRTQASGLGGGTNMLPNTSGSVVLRDSSNSIIDQVNYSYTWGGNRVYVQDPPNYYYYHYSLERINPLGLSQDNTNWGSSAELNYLYIRKVGGFSYYYYSYCTPGKKNSISKQ